MRVEQVNLTSKTNSYRQVLCGVLSAPEICEHPPREKLPDGSLGEVLGPVWLYCKNPECGRRKKVNRECGRPDCPRYNMKKTLKNFRRFLSLITLKKPESRVGFRQTKMWNRVDLTGVIIPLDSFLRVRIRIFGNALKQFLAAHYPDGGVAVIEFTNRYKTRVIGKVLQDFGDIGVQGPCTLVDYELVALYLHGHAMCFGGYKDKPRFEEDWGKTLVKAGLLSDEEFSAFPAKALAHEKSQVSRASTAQQLRKRMQNIAGYEKISGGRYVDLSIVRSVYGSARYCLGYIMKGNTLPEEFWAQTKALKLVRPWGYLYGKAPTEEYVCADCYSKIGVAFWEFDPQMPDVNRGPLKLVLVPKEVGVGPP